MARCAKGPGEPDAKGDGAVLDCLPVTSICIPSEYGDYWEHWGPVVRADADRVRRDGPVFIRVEARDAMISEPIQGLQRLELEGSTLFYEFTCESATSCLLRVADRPTQAVLTAPRNRATLSQHSVTSRDAQAMAAALGKLRYCVGLDRCTGPSISFAELRAHAEANPPAPTPVASTLDCAEVTMICIPREYDRYWNFTGSIFRAGDPPITTTGPVFISVHSSDQVVAEPVAGFTRTTFAGVTVVHDFSCDTPARCTLRFGWILGPERDAEYAALRGRFDLPPSDDLVLRRITVAGLDAQALDTALGKLRVCPVWWQPCTIETSKTFAELKATQGK